MRRKTQTRFDVNGRRQRREARLEDGLTARENDMLEYVKQWHEQRMRKHNEHVQTL